MVMCFLDGAL
jgi:hypothetical protein